MFFVVTRFAIVLVLLYDDLVVVLIWLGCSMCCVTCLLFFVVWFVYSVYLVDCLVCYTFVVYFGVGFVLGC